MAHSCLCTFRLKPLDIEFMKQLHNKVNIVPVIAKADCLTKKEVQRLKSRVSALIQGVWLLVNIMYRHSKQLVFNCFFIGNHKLFRIRASRI